MRAALSALALVLFATACAPILRGAGGSGGSAIDDSGDPPPCTAASVGSCSLPYPSNEFTRPDETSPTGIRLAMPQNAIPSSVLGALGPGGGIDDAFGGADGFSPLSPVVFQLDVPARPESIPADGGDVLAVFDRDSGERQRIRVHLWTDAAFRGAPGTIVMAWPEARWEYGRTYVARMAEVDGFLPVDPGPAPGIVRRDAHLGALLDRLAEVDPRSDGQIISATEFTVRSRGDAIGGLEKMAWIAGADDHPVRNLVSRPPAFFSHGAAVVTGEVRITDFRDDNGVVDADRPPGEDWIPFVVALPSRPASQAGAPVAVYGHGLTINKESMFLVASQNAARGVATIGIDMPNHGGRQAGQGGYLLDLDHPRHLGRLVGVPPQGIVDHVSLVAAIRDHMVDMDLSPWKPFGPPGDGRADLDTSVMLYEGTSMGGVLGAAEFALIPDLQAAFLQVPGAGVLDILSHSMLWPLFVSVIPSGANAGDAAALLGAASMLLDLGEPTYLLDRLVSDRRPVVAQVGIGDSIVPEFASRRLVESLGLPRIDTRGPSGLGADGRGYIEVWPSRASPLTLGFMGHISFDEPAARALLDEWLVQRLAAAGIG